MHVLDTHVLLWVISGDRRLGRKAHRLIDNTDPAEIHVSAITWWEFEHLAGRGRFSSRTSAASIRDSIIRNGVREQPLTGAMVMDAVGLPTLPPDPADRFITATARALRSTLITADKQLLEWPGELKRLNART